MSQGFKPSATAPPFATRPASQIASRFPVQPKLPHLQPGRQSRKPKVAEDVIQKQVMYHLRLDGYIVLSTSEHRKREACPHCRKSLVSSAGRGCDKGVPDLLVRDPDWPDGIWAGIEMKGSHTAISPEQKTLRDEGAIYICRSKDEVYEALQRICLQIAPQFSANSSL